MKLPRVVQCKKCPWRLSTNPRDVPNGYCEKKHKGLETTITSGLESLTANTAMACHHSVGGDGMYCVGWLHNQLGSGNNIGLRLRMLYCDNINDLQLVGEQHETFEDTLPEG